MRAVRWQTMESLFDVCKIPWKITVVLSTTKNIFLWRPPGSREKKKIEANCSHLQRFHCCSNLSRSSIGRCRNRNRWGIYWFWFFMGQCSSVHPMANWEVRCSSSPWHLGVMESYLFCMSRWSIRFEVILMLLGRSLLCSWRIVLFPRCNKGLSRLHIVTLSCVSVLSNVFNVFCKRNLTVLLASTWRRTGTVFSLKLQPVQMIRYFLIFWKVFWCSSIGRTEFSCLIPVGNDRLSSVVRSERMHQILNLGHSSLIFKYCILWNSSNLEVYSEEVSSAHDLSLLDSLPCSNCQAFFSTIFGATCGIGILWFWSNRLHPKNFSVCFCRVLCVVVSNHRPLLRFHHLLEPELSPIACVLSTRDELRKCKHNCGSSKVRWNVDEMEWLLRNTQTAANKIPR